MANARSIRAGRAFVELFADDSKLVRGLRRAERKVKAFGDSIRNLGLKTVALGAAILAPLAASARLFAGYGDSVAKMARRTGLSVEALSELQFAAGQSGVAVSDLENGVRRMQRTAFDAQRGLKSATDALAALGLSADALAGLSTEAQFKLLAERISRIEDPTRKAAIAMQLFGRSGTQLLPLFASGAHGIEVLQAEARRLGLTLSGEDAQAAEAFSDTLDRLWKVVRMGVFNIGSALAPTLEALAERFTRVAMAVSAWIKQNQGFIVSALKLGAVIVGVGIALTVLGTIISGIGSVLGVLASVIGAVLAVLKVLAAAIAFLASPVGIVIAAVIALGAYLLHVTGIGAKALDWLGAKFQALKERVLRVFKGIADALAAGDIGLAARILWLTLKAEWTRGVNFLEKAWLNFRDFFIKIGYDAWHGVLAAVQRVWHALELGWIETTAFFSKLWQGFTGFFSKSWERIKAGALKAWNWIKRLFDSSIDLESENRLVEEQTQAAIARIDDEQHRRSARHEARRETERRRAAAMHEATLAEIGRENLDRHRRLDTAYAQRMAENDADLAKARQEWREAVETARQRRETAAETAPERAEGPDAIIRKAREALAGLGDIGDLVQAEAARVGVRGTFNAAALQGLMAGDAADRTAQATEETARNTRRLVQAARSGGLTFA